MTAVQDPAGTAGDPLRILFQVHPRKQQTGVVVLLHGLNSDAADYKDLAEMWAQDLPHVRFIVPSAPLYPPCPDRNKFGAWYAHDENDNLVNIKGPWCDILQLIETERQNHGIPLKRVVIAGFMGVGSGMATWVALQMPEPCAGLILCHGGLNGHLSGKDCQKAVKTPVLYCNGLGDDCISHEGARNSRDLMKSWGYSVNYWEYPGHTLNKQVSDWIACFLRTMLPQAPADQAGVHSSCLGALIGHLGGNPLGDPLQPPHGTLVTVHSLKSVPQHNGKRGKVCSFDVQKKRVTVELKTGERISLKPDNYTQHLTVKLLGVRREGEFAGCLNMEAKVIGTEANPQGNIATYKLELSGTGRVATLGPEVLLLPAGAVVTLVGLSSGKGQKLVGRFCRIAQFEGGRYIINIEGESNQLSVSPKNLRP